MQSDPLVRLEAQKVGILFSEAIIALSKTLEGQPLILVLDEVAKELKLRMPPGTVVNAQYMLPAVRHLMARTLNQYR